MNVKNEVIFKYCAHFEPYVKFDFLRDSRKGKVIRTRHSNTRQNSENEVRNLANTSYVRVILDLTVAVNEHCCHLIVWRSLFVSSLHFSMATRPPQEPSGSRVMLRRCIFLISTSENFVSRYVPSSGLARHIGVVAVIWPDTKRRCFLQVRLLLHKPDKLRPTKQQWLVRNILL